MTLKTLQTQALRLPVERRAKLAVVLLSSLDAEGPSVEQAWLEETDRRFRAFRQNKRIGIPADTAMRTARASLR